MTGRAEALPLHGLGVAGKELLRGGRRRLARTDRAVAERAMASACRDGWVLITGASAGIGRAYAEALAARGANLLLVADDEVRLAAVAGALRTQGGAPRCETLAVDLAEPASVARIVSWVGDRQVDVLVNNAGLGAKGVFVVGDPDDYARMVAVNLLAPVLLTRALLPAMVARNRGAVVHVASLNALAPMPSSAVYSATKSFLLAYATAVWFENRDSGVAFQTVLPGTTATAFHSRQGTSLPSWAMTPEQVATSSLAALGADLVHVPGAVNRVLRRLGAVLPLRARTAAAGAVAASSLGAE